MDDTETAITTSCMVFDMSGFCLQSCLLKLHMYVASLAEDAASSVADQRHTYCSHAIVCNSVLLVTSNAGLHSLPYALLHPCDVLELDTQTHSSHIWQALRNTLFDTFSCYKAYLIIVRAGLRKELALRPVYTSTHQTCSSNQTGFYMHTIASYVPHQPSHIPRVDNKLAIIIVKLAAVMLVRHSSKILLIANRTRLFFNLEHTGCIRRDLVTTAGNFMQINQEVQRNKTKEVGLWLFHKVIVSIQHDVSERISGTSSIQRNSPPSWAQHILPWKSFGKTRWRYIW